MLILIKQHHNSASALAMNDVSMKSHIYSSSGATSKSNRQRSSWNGSRYVEVTLQVISTTLSCANRDDPPVVLFADLIFFQRFSIVVVADKGVLEAFTSLNGIGDRGTAHDQPAIFDAREVFQLLELSHEDCFVFLCDFGTKFEEYCS